ncbi:MAG: nuclear transport factor 2 family protein [Pseudomonadota bacterium]
MKHRFHAAAAAAVIALSTLATLAHAEGTGKMTQDQEDVLALISKMTGSFEAGDLDRVMQTYEADQTIMFEPGKPVSDAKGARLAFERFLAVSPKFSYSGHEVIVEGDIAVHIAPWQMTGTDPAGKPVEAAGLSIAVLRRQADGAWKMVIDNPHGSHLLTGSAD